MGNIRDEIAKNMLYYRKRAGFTQKQLADLLGVRNSSPENLKSEHIYFIFVNGVFGAVIARE